ncbi:leucyl/phenylalanyl-tRNA--protein transferase [Candidatus Poribacteria bacterium]|nr:leucyl/phenylalanyl-tRNA--protein transferase [Candidatus Poribacteria bacterium]
MTEHWPVRLDPARLWFPRAESAPAAAPAALGGDLSLERLLLACQSGFFPWYGAGRAIEWWSPDPRAIIPCGEFHTSRTLAKVLRQRRFAVTFDRAFERVVRACAEPRPGPGGGVWIVPEMVAAYLRLHEAGWAHSAEAWREGELAGGVYGVSIGRAFFAESMFRREGNASKAALATLMADLQARGFAFLDCQFLTPHLASLGARWLGRREYLRLLRGALRGHPPAVL